MPTFVDLLRRRAGEQPTGRALLFVEDAGQSVRSISYGELDRAARRVAAALVARGAAGRPVLLLYPPGLEFVTGLLGCLYAAAIAVPAYPPDPGRWSRTLPRLRALAGDCGATVALTVSGLAGMAPELADAAPELAALDWVATDTLPGDVPASVLPEVDGDSLALLQYTSGSTGAPRGVLLSHVNLLHNSSLIHAGFGASSETVAVSWLPPYHDMGLIGGILQPLYGGFPIVLMSPLAFLQRPISWLETIARYGATVSGGPNFAFDLCVRKSTPQQRAELDLSRWRLAFCGAEPVRPETLDRFAEAFAPAGFRREAFYPCYGLAEATLIVTGGQSPSTVRTGQLGCGMPLGEQRLAVVDPDTAVPRPAGTEGEIWLAGPSVAQGYWRRQEETERTFHARLVSDPDHHYLRTGDLGFLTAGGELVVTGRIKDLIIVRGRNLYPQDLEYAVEREVAGVRPGCSAAFPVERGGVEAVGLVCELAAPPASEPDAAATVAAIRQTVAETAEVQVATVVLLRRGQVPKTSSGKIQRHACRRAVLAGEWQHGGPDVLVRWDEDVAGELSAPDPGTASARDLVAATLGTVPDAVSEDTPLTRLGLDSLRAIELQDALVTNLAVRVSLAELLGGITTAELAARPASSPDLPAPAAESAESAASPGGERPATPGQRAMWLLQRWSPESTAYQISRAARIQSIVDVEVLERALRVLVDRHQALRTCLPAHDGRPVQRVCEWPGPVVTHHRLTGLDGVELRRRVQIDADRPFDLASGPLWRASLYSRDDADHVLLLSLHHSITDFWSLSVLVDELLTLYTTLSTGSDVDRNRPRTADEVPGSGTDLVTADPAKPDPAKPDPAKPDPAKVAYWREVLRGAPPALELPTTFPRPRLQSFRGATCPLELDAGVLTRLDEFATDAGLTRFAVLTAGLAAVLARHTGEDDLVLGAPAAHRDGRQSDALGYFVNPVPLRIRVSPGGTFRDLALRVRQVIAGALDHAMPFPQLVEAVQPVRDPSRSPITQAMVVLLQPPPGRTDLGAFAVGDESTRFRRDPLDLRPYQLAESGAAFDMALTMAEVDGRLSGYLTYCADLFDRPAAARFSDHLATLLAGAVSDPDAPLATINVMSRSERQAVLALATGPTRPYPDQTTLPALFTQRAAQQPDATAVVACAQSLSNRELDERADRIAARLVAEYGVRRGDIVGVYAPRGLDAVVAFWAAMKSGGAYLPLAPDLPPRRLAWLIADARPAVVLTTGALADQLPGDGRAQLRLDDPEPPVPDRLAREPVDEDRAGPDDLAYVLYTSGSTGHPKGVMLTHRAACNLATVLVQDLEIAPSSRVLQLASCAYDVHVADHLLAHLHGASLHLPAPEATVPGPALVDTLARDRISHVIVSPSLLGALPEADLPDLTHILCGGEPLTPEIPARWAPGRRFSNAYGPTEATVCVTWGPCDPADRRRPSIGRPMPNGRTYILDSRMEPVPVGIPGEICIGGVAVGTGYLGRPDLTAERFVPDPYDPRPGARLYRSGDRARWLPDGTVDFLGRFDDQVKIRGARVEPGEVEARIRELVEAREVAVVPQTGPGGSTELVAYLVAARARRMPVADLRGLLRAELPEPWLPAAFVYLDALPLNRSGKIDRRGLPPPAPADRGLAERLAPRTELERLVAEVWSGALRQATVGVRDHFFDELGGSSLLVAEVTGQLGRRLERDIPVTWMFQHPTVETLARRISRTGDDDQPGPTPEDQAERRRRALARRTQPRQSSER